jgi:hypothetical protein
LYTPPNIESSWIDKFDKKIKNCRGVSFENIHIAGKTTTIFSSPLDMDICFVLALTGGLPFMRDHLKLLGTTYQVEAPPKSII